MLLNYVINVYKDPLNVRSFIRTKKKEKLVYSMGE